jgi:hypothetical protein
VIEPSKGLIPSTPPHKAAFFMVADEKPLQEPRGPPQTKKPAGKAGFRLCDDLADQFAFATLTPVPA